MFSSYLYLLVKLSILNKFCYSNFTLTNNAGNGESMNSLNSFFIFACTITYFDIAIGSSKIKLTVTLELVHKTYTLVTLVDWTKIVFKMNQAFLNIDPSQNGALFINP